MTINIRGKNILQSALVRIVFGLVICLASVIIGQQLFLKIPGVSMLHANTRNFGKGLFVCVLLLSSYWLFYHKYEKRAVTELSMKGMSKKLLAGIATGSGLQLLTILVIYFFAGFKIIAVNPFSTLIIPFTVAFTVAVIEEVLLRGIVFRITEEKLGSTIALVLSGLVFAGLHLVNPHMSLLSIACIAVVGVLLGAAYMYDRNIWLPVAIHFAWNFTQEGIFGAITSGNEKTSSLFTTRITGPEILTGAQFGPEGSIQALLFCLMATMVIIRLLQRQHKFLKIKPRQML